MEKIRTYSELIMLPTFIERYEYLKLNGIVGQKTFGSDRYICQAFYNSQEWKRDIRNRIILRDNGCDLGVDGYDIYGKIYVHHLNPITVDDIINRTPYAFDPEYMILTSFNTHEAIHYGDENLLVMEPIVRRRNDTCPWKK